MCLPRIYSMLTPSRDVCIDSVEGAYIPALSIEVSVRGDAHFTGGLTTNLDQQSRAISPLSF